MGALLLIEFSTLSDYLFLLRTVAEALGPHGPTIMFYLAAAVSDFYIPDENMVRFQLFVFSKSSLVPSHHGVVILFNTITFFQLFPLRKELGWDVVKTMQLTF